MKTALLFLLAFPLVAIPAGARDKNFPEEESRQVLQDYAKCVVKKNPELVGQYIRYEYTLPKPFNRRVFEQLMPPSCLKSAGFVSRLTARDLMIRGALAEQLLKRDGIPILTLSSRNLVTLGFPVVGEFSPVGRSGKTLTGSELEEAKIRYARSVLDDFVLQLGQCVTRAAPDRVKSVIETSLDDPEEIAAMRALSSEIAGCVSSGETLKFNRTNLRAAMAISYYRFITTTPQSVNAAHQERGATNA